MRPLSNQERAALVSRRAITHVRVIVMRFPLSAVNLGELLGRDWVMGVQWSESQDETVGLATVAVRRNGPAGIVSLSPMVATSPANRGPTGLVEPLLKEGRTFRIDVQTTPSEEPTPGAWQQVFLGRIDDIDAGPEELSFTGRDFAGVFQDVFIETERDYGNNTVGVAVQEVMTAIIGDNVPTGTGPGLHVPVDPMWQLGRYTQERETVHEACQKLAAQLGWELRLRFVDGLGWQLVLQSPERLADEPVWTFGPDDYVELSRVQRRLTDIRNAVEVVYTDINDRDALGNAKRKSVLSTNPTSIAEHGRRYMQVTEASASNINTEVEAQRLADAAIADLSDSALDVEVEVPYVWALEVNDVVRVLPDDVHLDEAVDLAIVSIDPVFTSGTAKMKLQLRGRPSISRSEWKARNARPSTGSSPAERSIQVTAKMKGPDAPSDLQPTATVNGFALAFKPAPTGPAWDSYELHVSTSPGFTPGAATLKAAASATRFEVADLQPGTTHYAVVRGRDAHGNVGPTSEQVALSPRYVEPRFTAPMVTWGVAPLNYDFESQASSSVPPDNWRVEMGIWGADLATTPDSVSGSRALQLQSTDAVIVSQAISVRPGLRYSIDAFAKGTDEALLTMALEWLDATGATISVENFHKMFTAGEPWARYVHAAPAPATARFVRARLSSVMGVAGGTIQIDSVQVDLADIVQEPTLPPPVVHGSWEPYTDNGRGRVTYYKDSTGRVHLEGAITGGTIGTNALTLPARCRPPATRDFAVATSTGYGRVTVTADGVVIVASGSPAWVSLNGVSFRAG
ncbi:hypothetical protein [Myxococcus sp. AM010]|uniref:hypothetical protein n=1 Tax=Myxococcus sp. AM010 TaxID=2745138 RepID=UPI001595C7B6|nr:hypothetical protein [Myxococcus sp. AM010]NVJ13122.1 hypothetical protein [Myxococcus sp. AM010]